MITDNGKKAMLITMLYSSGSSNNIFLVPVKVTAGYTAYLSNACSSSNMFPRNIYDSVNFPSTNTNGLGILIGSGTTPASSSDYNMESVFKNDSHLSSSNLVIAFDYSVPNKYAKIFTFTVTNGGTDSVTVGELGYVQSMNIGTQGSTATNSNYLLLDHTLLDTPVTIPAGESATITYRMEIDLTNL